MAPLHVFLTQHLHEPVHLSKRGIVAEVWGERADDKVGSRRTKQDRLDTIERRGTPCGYQRERVDTPIDAFHRVVDDGWEARWRPRNRYGHRQADVVDVDSRTIHSKNVEAGDRKRDRASHFDLRLERLLMVVVGRVRRHQVEPIGRRVRFPLSESHRFMGLWTAYLGSVVIVLGLEECWGRCYTAG